MKSTHNRTLWLLSLIAVILILIQSWYLETYLHIMPCPLCALQRFTFIILGILFFGALLTAPYRFMQFVLGLTATLFAALGIVLAGRQIWLQMQPQSQSGDCGASLEYLMRALPFNEAIQKIFAGSSECATVTWQFLHHSLAEWSLLFFIILFLISFVQTVRSTR